MSQQGDNKTINMLVGDIYGGLDYSKIGLSASTIYSSFGKTIEDYKPEDISLSLWRMISYNIRQISWMEKFLRIGPEITAPVPMAPPGTTGLGGFEVPSSRGDTLRSDACNMNVGVQHLVPTLEVFPLLADLKNYEPNTVDLADPSELEYWFTVLSEHLPSLVEKAVAK